MKAEFRDLRIKQLERALAPFWAARAIPRPQKGWLRAMREVSGVTLQVLGKRLGGIAPSSVYHLEQSEADSTISLGHLRDAAEALGCQLVYALVPKTATVRELVELGPRSTAEQNVRAVEHSMALENQAVGGVDQKVEEETRRILKRR